MPNDNGEKDRVSATMKLSVERSENGSERHLRLALENVVDDCTSGNIQVEEVEIHDW